MSYRLLAADMDGTLLNDEGVMSSRTQAAIRKIVAAGICFVPATGRAMPNMEHISTMFEGSEKDLPFILYNGAMVVLHRSRRILFSASLQNQDAKEIYKMGMEKNLTMRVWSQNRMYFDKDCELAQKYQKKVNFKVEFINSQPDNSIDILAKQGITKIVWIDDPCQIRDYQDSIGEHFKGRVNCHTSNPELLEFVHISASKAIAMEKIGEHLGIKQEEMVAIGDGYNDLSMLRYAGYSVAMGNAPEDIKAICNLVTLSNNEDGVATFIDDFFM